MWIQMDDDDIIESGVTYLLDGKPATCVIYNHPACPVTVFEWRMADNIRQIHRAE